MQTSIIFPLSNPTERAEATAADLIEWTNGHALITTGSPFEPVSYQDRTITIAGATPLAFPIGMGVIATKAKHVPSKVLCSKSSNMRARPMQRGPISPLLPSIEGADVLAQEVT